MLELIAKLEAAHRAYRAEREETEDSLYDRHQPLIDAAEDELYAAARAEGLSGIIENVTFKTPGDLWNSARYPNLSGRVVFDFKGRFHSSETISTSRLVKVYTENGRTFAKTAFSLYELVGFAPTAEEIPEDFRYAFEAIS